MSPRPADAAQQARAWRIAAREPGINPAEVLARVEQAATYQALAVCGTHPHGDRSEEDAA